jgi:hypothetical protein
MIASSSMAEINARRSQVDAQNPERRMSMTPDFREIIFLLGRHTGLPDYRIAQKVGMAPGTLSSLKNASRDPLYSHGVALLDLYVKEVGREVPVL